MKRSVKSVIASAAAIFMCAAPAISSVPVLPVVESITASAAQYPVALDYMGHGYAANGLLYQQQCSPDWQNHQCFFHQCSCLRDDQQL